MTRINHAEGVWMNNGHVAVFYRYAHPPEVSRGHGKMVERRNETMRHLGRFLEAFDPPGHVR